MTIRNLEHILAPRSVAVIGASTEAGSVGKVLTENMLAGGFTGQVYLVNPHHRARSAAGAASRCRCAARDAGPCGDRHAARHRAGRDRRARQEGHAARSSSSRRGFARDAEAGDARCGAAVLPAHHRAELPRHRRAWDRAQRQFRLAIARKPGKLAFLSQSGALITGILDWAMARGIGFSYVVSMGDMADVDVGDLLDFLAADISTSAILLYLETIPAGAQVHVGGAAQPPAPSR